MTTSDKPKKWWKALLFSVLFLAPLVPFGCQSDPAAPSPAAFMGTGPVVDGGAPPSALATTPCSDEGAVQDCSKYLGEYGGVLSCYVGQQTCSAGHWGSCGDGDVVNLSVSAARSGSSGLLALSSPLECLNNPCDPNCWGFAEVPDAAIRPDAGSASVIWPGGSLEEFPGGLVNKGIKEPCQWGYDCQFNRKCQLPVTGAGCSHSKCMPGLPLDKDCDPCVEAICAEHPSCCDTSGGGPVVDYQNKCKGHDPCETGDQLKANCHDCVTDICAMDPYCCEGGGQWVSKQVYVCTGNGWRRTCGWEWQQVWEAGSWDWLCTSHVESVCELLCPWGSGTVAGSTGTSTGEWSDSCVDKVDTICGAECGQTAPSSCVHSVCDPGAPLDALCHSCATSVCAADPYCCISGWDASCVARVAKECGQSCPVTMLDPPPEQGKCVPWLPSQQRDSCDGIDLGGGVVCGDVMPVCNHGTKTAPAGIRIIHFPGNSQQFPKNVPDQTHPQMEECFTSSPIPPGQCVGVTTCAGLDSGNREIMVNPPDLPGASATYHVDECQMNDNWTLRSNGVSCVEPECSGGDSEAVIRRVNLLLIVDVSGSMQGSKWTGTTAALKGFARSAESAGLNLALEFFSLRNGGNRGDGCAYGSCSSTPCSNPMVPLGVLLKESGSADPQEVALVNAVDSVSPGGMTPTYPALQGGLDWAISGRNANLSDVYAVVLVTDGEPTECETRTDRIAKLSYDAYTGAGIKTYTVGMDGADIGALNTVANAGGTGSAFKITAGGDVEQELIAVFQAIAKENAQCIFELENADAIDPYDGSVTFYSSVNGSTEPLPYLTGPDECGDGWYFDNPDQPTSVLLCGNTCDVVQSDNRAKLDLGFGCAKPYTTTERFETYSASCPESQGPQWGFLSYDTTIIEDSQIHIAVRTAATEAALATATFVSLADVGPGASSPAVCSMFGPAPNCPVALYPALGGIPNARYPYLELKITMDPASNEYKAPLLNDWEITYSCGYDQ